jgi:phosphatidylglycerophosphatase A
VGDRTNEPRGFSLRTDASPSSSAVLHALVIFIATGGYVGYLPIVPGSAGSVLGLLIAHYAAAPVWKQLPAVFLILFVALFVISCVIADSAEQIFGQHDCPAIVLDEILGIVATMFLNPTGLGWLGAGFVLFRVLDIIKPWPAARFDRMHGGVGVMLDDLAAGVYANLALQALRRVI